MIQVTINGDSQALRFVRHSGSDAANATEAIIALRINGEILHADTGPTMGTHRNMGNVIAGGKNTVPMIARPP
jgi:hypothetical protein